MTGNERQRGRTRAENADSYMGTGGRMKTDTASSAPDTENPPQLIDLGLLFYHIRSAFRRFYFMILILCSLCAGVMCVHEVTSYTPSYKCETIMTVSVDVSATTNFYNITTARQMAASFPSILSSSQLMDLIRDDLGIDTLGASVSASAVEDTNLITLTVKSEDAKRAYDVMQSTLRLYPEIAEMVIGATQLHLITEPALPTVPENAMDIRGAAVKGIIAGAALFCAMLVLYAVLDLTIVNAQGIEDKLHGKCLARIPTAMPADRNMRKESGIYDLREPYLNPTFYEAMRTLRHDVKRLCAAVPSRTRKVGAQTGVPGTPGTSSVRDAADGAKVIMLTSTSGNEGKSTVSINLGLSLAASGAKVLLIDCDLRKPALKSHLGYQGKTPGLAAVLRRKVSLRDAIGVLPGSTLHVLLSESYTPNAAELFGTDNLDTLLASLRGVYDYILLDTAPVALVSDTTALARSADAILYIIRQDYVFTSRIYDAVHQLSAAGTEMLGFVLNITDKGSMSAKYGYGYGYGKYGKYSKYGK
ncbi:MAG: polysaccharide biosynthesis tyrosine autokinase [Clostridia bacterium]|nr:polysaccharide biosynthesis tyrosine autokinase [Clostridia bacterium]